MSLSALQNSAMMAADQAQSRARLRAASTSTVDEAKLKDACRQMESVFVGMLWKEMRKTLSNDSMLYGGIGEDIFTSQLDQAYSDLSTKQRSMGLADMLYQQMKPQSVPRPSGNLAGGYKSSGAAASGLAIPLTEARVTSTFGTRVHPVSGEVKQHNGLDLAAPEGTPVAAAADGKVVFRGRRRRIRQPGHNRARRRTPHLLRASGRDHGAGKPKGDIRPAGGNGGLHRNQHRAPTCISRSATKAEPRWIPGPRWPAAWGARFDNPRRLQKSAEAWNENKREAAPPAGSGGDTGREYFHPAVLGFDKAPQIKGSECRERHHEPDKRPAQG